MKKKYSTTLLLGAAAVVGLTAAKAPEIDTARIDSMVAQELMRADADPNQTHKPDGAAIRKNAVLQLQTFEVLKNEAFKIGLDKNPEVRSRFQNFEAQFYAAQYAHHLEQQAVADEGEIRAAYDEQTRLVKLQQVSFATPDEARAAQALLLKGLSFEELMKRYPNPDQAFDGFIHPQQLPPELAAVGRMVRGETTREPLALNGRFYLFKVAEVGRSPDAPPLEQVKAQFEAQVKQQKVQQQIERLLKENGVQP